MITIKNLTKNFGARTILKNINLHIPAGQATAIVGPNGSGKTTLIKSILDLVRPSSGQITVAGELANNGHVYREKIGYMPQIARYPENMKVRELIDFIRNVRNGNPAQAEELIEYFGLKPELGKKMRMLSGGTKQKVGAVLAMMFNPPVLIFDEPTAGLDPHSSVRFKKRVLDQKVQGKTILMASHIMSELEELADYLIFIVEGQIRYNGPIADLKETRKESRLEGAVAKLMEEMAV